eukprot:2809734-Rhodomonas_salina.1
MEGRLSCAYVLVGYLPNDLDLGMLCEELREELRAAFSFVPSRSTSAVSVVRHKDIPSAIGTIPWFSSLVPGWSKRTPNLNWTKPKGFHWKSNVPSPQLQISPPELQNLATYPGTKEENHGINSNTRVKKSCQAVARDATRVQRVLP